MPCMCAFCPAPSPPPPPPTPPHTHTHISSPVACIPEGPVCSICELRGACVCTFLAVRMLNESTYIG